MATQKKARNFKETALQHRKNKIISGEYPPNSAIQEDSIATELSISRTPVREAIQELQREGYVEIVPRKSTRVAKISLKDMLHVYNARLVIEVNTIRSIPPIKDPEAINALLNYKRKWEALADMDITRDNIRRFTQLDLEFHIYLISLCNNPYFIKFCTEMYMRSHRFWHLSMYLNSRTALVTGEHLAIIDSALKGKSNELASLIELHITNSRNALGLIDE